MIEAIVYTNLILDLTIHKNQKQKLQNAVTTMRNIPILNVVYEMLKKRKIQPDSINRQFHSSQRHIGIATPQT